MNLILGVRKTIVFVLLLMIFGFVGLIFYKVEIKYLSPTPIPDGYKEVIVNTEVKLEDLVSSNNSTPTFFHFYNPDCPCSRFNLDHFKELYHNYGDKMNFLVVAQYNNNNTIATITEHIGREEGLKVYIDRDQKLAKELGVYSTPQAVVLNSEGNLYYRGNYNKSRYCTDPGKFYAQQAIDSLLMNKGVPVFDKAATRAYGCVLDEEKDILDKLLIIN